MRKIAGEVMLIPVSGETADLQNVFALNRTAEVVWSTLADPCPVSAIVDKVTSTFDVARATAETDVRELLDEMLTAGVAVGEAEEAHKSD